VIQNYTNYLLISLLGGHVETKMKVCFSLCHLINFDFQAKTSKRATRCLDIRKKEEIGMLVGFEVCGLYPAVLSNRCTLALDLLPSVLNDLLPGGRNPRS
jgi:hypothetical protein